MPPPPKRDPEAEKQAMEWIEAILGKKFDGPFDDVLKNGVVLCQLINKLAPGSVKKIAEKGMDFKLMENISAFQAAVKKYGVEDETFQTVDLWQKKNISAVTKCIFALGRVAQKHPEFNGPILGPKESDANKREFTEEQLRAGEGHVGLQAGFAGGASQAGQSFGKQRMIQD
ncbi:myophilin-like [Tubulanus polymorphus]|uniref:myophilin-like n=1 Tax=Tubulanus polymorphus TaxID=672921 RepID=UPI003DA5DDAA